MKTNHIYIGDCLEVLKTFPDESINCCVTSPPYWGLRDYGTAKWEGGNSLCKHHPSKEWLHNNFTASSGVDIGNDNQRAAGIIKWYNKDGSCSACGAIRIDKQLGLEKTPEEYVAKMVEVFREVKRVLTKDGTLFLNLGDCYAGSGKAGNNEEYQKKHTQFGKIETKERMGKVFSAKSINLKDKDLVGIPWMVAFALRADGWYLRSDIIWHKPNPMPESVTDRPTKSHEYIFLLTKSGNKILWKSRDTNEWSKNPDLDEIIKINGEDKKRWEGFDYFYDADAIKEDSINPTEDYSKTHKTGNKRNPTKNISGFRPRKEPAIYEKRNKRSVWTVNTQPYKEAHFATFPPKLIGPCILAGCPKDGIVLDPFGGSGTTGQVAEKYNRKWILIELNKSYKKLMQRRTAQRGLKL